MEKILSELGLSKNEGRVYLALLRHGRMQLRDITKATGMYRQNALESLEKLQARGLVSISFEGKRRAYSAAGPERLGAILDERQRRLESALPGLLALAGSAEKPKIDMLSGSEGVKTILRDEIATGKAMHIMQSSQTVDTMAGSYLAISREKRAAAGIAMKIIYSAKDRKFGEVARKYARTEVRYLGEDFGSTTIDVYGDRTVLIFGEEPTIIRIIDKEVARRFLQFFNASWARAKK